MQNMQESMVNEGIVSETSFPTPTGRLEQLISQYRSQTGNVEPYSAGKGNPLRNVTLRNECKTRTFAELSAEEQKTVLSRIVDLDYLNSVDIQTFGSAKESALTKHSETIIAQYKANDLEELSAPITELVAILKSNNPRNIIKTTTDSNKKGGFFSELKKSSLLEKAKKEMHQQLAEHQNILRNINEIVKVLKKHQVRLFSDITIYQEMTRNTFSQIKEFELDRIALQLLEDDAQEKLEDLMNSSKEGLDLIEASKATELSAAIERVKRKSFNIQSVRTATIQCLPQLAELVYGDEILCEKIDEIENLLKPLWEWQYAIAIGALHQKEVIHINKKIRGFTSILLKENAELMHDNMIAAQEALHEATVAIEDLAIVQDYIDDMVTSINRIRQEAAAKSVDALKKMNEIEAKNINLMKASLTKTAS